MQDRLMYVCLIADKQRRGSSAEAAAEEGGLAERAENAGEDHAQGMAAMPQSRNAPTSLSMRRVSQEGPHEPGFTLGSASPGPGVSEQEAGMCLPSPVPRALLHFQFVPLLLNV